MKRVLTILAVLVSILCGSTILISCSDGYKKMYLTAEYALPDDEGKTEWKKVESGVFDYTLEDRMYSSEDNAYILNLRINVKGSSKKVKSLYISTSESTAVVLKDRTVKPNERIKVYVKTIGSVTFTITPSNGGADKAISFTVNIYKQLEAIGQNGAPGAVPALMTGDAIQLDAMPNLIQYTPKAGITNQTGVDYSLVGVGTLTPDGSTNLLGREFKEHTPYSATEDGLAIKNDEGEKVVTLENTPAGLLLNVAGDYKLGNANNVIELLAKSKYNEEITTKVYVYIVEKFSSNSWVVGYDRDVEEDVNGTFVLTGKTEPAKEVNKTEVIYDSKDNSVEGQGLYNELNLYTHIKKSIYSYATNPGMNLRVEINGVEYDYNDSPSNKFGIKVSPVNNDGGLLIGLKFAVYPEGDNATKKYDISLMVDFNAFDFSGSITKPIEMLRKEFTINVEKLPSAFEVNGIECKDNLQSVMAGGVVPSVVSAADYSKVAELYTEYKNSKGMPLVLKVLPTDVTDTTMNIKFYKTYGTGQALVPNKEIKLFGANTSDAEGFNVKCGLGKETYLSFGSEIDFANLEEIYMVCTIASTPKTFAGKGVDVKYITYISKIKVVGAVQNVYLHRSSEDSAAGTTLDDEYLPTVSTKKPYNTAYIKFVSNAVIDYSKVEIKSANDKIYYSANGYNWSNSISAGELKDDKDHKVLYFRSATQGEDSIIIDSASGDNLFAREYKFVNVVENTESVKVSFDKTYVTQFETENGLITDEITVNEKGDTAELAYLALQSGQTVQFLASADGKSSNVKMVTALNLTSAMQEFGEIKKGGERLYSTTNTLFDPTAIGRITPGVYMFDVPANNAGLTAIVYVKVEYYCEINTEAGKDGEIGTEDDNLTYIDVETKYFVYEIAVYTPAKDIDVDAKDTILYINDNYTEAATANFDVNWRKGTSKIAFSSAHINDSINVSYDGKITSIYGVKVTPRDMPEGYFELSGLNNYKGSLYLDLSSGEFSVEAIKSLKELVPQSQVFDISIVQFGKETSHGISKVIYFGNHTAVEGIYVSGDVDQYDNIYLSLLTEEHNTTNLTVGVSNTNATYQEIDFKVYYVNGNTLERGDEYNGDNLDVIKDGNKVTITASTKGGLYEIEFYAKDSYDEGTEKYKVVRKIRVTVSDGKTSETAYLIDDIKDFIGLAENTNKIYYRLSDNIPLSLLNDSQYSSWWDKARLFEGHLDGAMTIYNPNAVNKEVVYKCYKLTGLTIAKGATLEGNVTFGLFNAIAENASIRNIIFTDVKFDITLNNDNTGGPVAIGAIAAINNGTIENCSISIESSAITFKSTNAAGDIDEAVMANKQQYSIGLISGVNNKEIKYNNTQFGSEYAYMADCGSGAKLDIVVESGNKKLSDAEQNQYADIYIGGVVGHNASGALVAATYEDNSDQAIRVLITAVVNIEFKTLYSKDVAPMAINSALGGVAGLNAGTISNAAISGNLKANDKINLGGVVGENVGTIQECANYGATIEGYSLNNELADAERTEEVLTYWGKDATQEQNIGGIIGYNNAKIVDKVRTLFITFDATDVAVNPILTYIKGVGNVSGVIGKASNTQLKHAYVENFVSNVSRREQRETETDEEYAKYILDLIKTNSNIIGTNANVAGLIADVVDTKTILCFVQADFSVEGGKFYEFGNGLTYEYVYFIGDVFGQELNATKNDATEDNAYIVHNVITLEGKELASTTNTYGLNDIEVSADDDKITEIQWRKGDDINNDYPYLVYLDKGNVVYTLTIVPEEIIVKVDEKHFNQTITEGGRVAKKYDDGLYIKYAEKEATAVVYYYEGGSNLHTLVSDDKNVGLIEKTIVPSIASGVYSVSIVSGAYIAELVDKSSQIRFKDVGTVKLRFVSLLNKEIEDTVTIFVENPLVEDVFKLSSSNGLEDRTGKTEQFTTSVGNNALISVDLPKVNKNSFNTENVYITSTVLDITNNSGAAVDNTDNKYFAFKANTKNVGEEGKYQLGDFELTTEDLPDDVKYISVTVEIGLYLNFNKYTIDEKTLTELYGKNDFKLDSKQITIVIYNKAAGLTGLVDITAESGVGISVKADLTTGYVAGSKAGSPDTTADGARLKAVGLGQDSVYYDLTAVNTNAKDLVSKAKLDFENDKDNAGKTFSIWDVFEYHYINYVKTDYGYTYTLDFRLKEEYRRLELDDYDDTEWVFKLKVTADTNANLWKEVLISFVPQQLTSFRIENYSNLVSRDGSTPGTTESEFVSNEVESSLIIPGESGLLKIYAQYDYSYFEDIVITSTSDSDYFVRFQQMLYDTRINRYVSYNRITANGESLQLERWSYIDADGKLVNDGVIYVRTLVDDIVGIKQLFEFTVSANTYVYESGKFTTKTITCDKSVITQYKPGVYLSVTNAAETQINHNGEDLSAYLVEQNSTSTQIIAKVYGYEYNVNPKIEITDFDNNVDPDGVELRFDSAKQDGDAYVLTYTLLLGTPSNFKVYMTMTLVDGSNTLISSSKELRFAPVPYVIDSVRLNGEANGALNINVNASKDIELEWTTKALTANKSGIINQAISDQISNYLGLFHIMERNSSGLLVKTTFDKLNHSKFSIKQNYDGKTYRIVAQDSTDVSIVVYFNLYYGYEGGQVKFSSTETAVCKNLITHQFDLNLIPHTTEDMPLPITGQTGQNGLANMAAGENYILMNDIILENWTPLTTAIASLDGNGKVITIKSFNITVASSVNAGLFATIGQGTIIKNVTINIAELDNDVVYIKDDNITGVNINLGILAGENNGLVYNCEVISLDKSKTVNIEIGASYSLVFGGLVGSNAGNITNSRVGTEYFERITQVGDKNSNDAASTVLRCGTIKFKSRGVMAGFVGQNSANTIISASYVANTSIENTSNKAQDKNRTAGFVATNNGTIGYSYVKGLERSILTTKARATDCKIYSSGSGTVAGFVYENKGTIHNSYSNIICESSSAAVAGFVYDTQNGAIEQCYSASTVVSGNKDKNLITELPFVGVGVDSKGNAKQLLSSEDVVNCYYLDDGYEYDTGYDIPEDVVEPKSLSIESFKIASNLNNYSFVLSGTTEQKLNGVWTYSTAGDKNKTTYTLGSTNLPELTSANAVARSVRFAMYDDNGKLINYMHARGYDEGSSKNPYIVRSVDEYVEVFVEGKDTNEYGQTYMAGYVRFIDDIDFKIDDSVYINIDTRSDYLLGDSTGQTFTSVDGNGVTISNVVINYNDKEDDESLGLFSEVNFAAIKALNINFASVDNDDNEVSDTNVNYAGGVAGKANNTYLIDINLTGNDVTLRANNVVGGLVGQLTGKYSGIYNISSNLNVKAGYATDSDTTGSNLYKDGIDVSGLSYAGGVAGIASIGEDVLDSKNKQININKITINANTVQAARAGGIAGYLGKNVSANRLTYIVTETSQVFGREVVGGIVGDNYADIALSQANNADIEQQYKYDVEFAKYINNGDKQSALNPGTNYGNLSAVTGAGVAGGFVGVNYRGDIVNSLTKANIGGNNKFGLAQTIGGFIGKSHGGDIKYAYAQNYIDLLYTTTIIGNGGVIVDSETKTTKTVGGLVGELVGDRTTKLGLDNVVAANWFDKSELTVKNINGKNENGEYEYNENKITVDYIIGSKDGDVNIVLDSSADTASGQGGPIVNYGVFDGAENGKEHETGLILNRHLATKANEYDMNKLYNITNLDNELFTEIFLAWPFEIWDLDYTKFMPNLKPDNNTDYIKIESKDDLYKFALYPDRNFILVKNVPVGDCENYVADIEFSGILRGALLESGEYAKFTGIKLNATTERNGSGFFRAVKSARITNIGFSYNEINLSGGGKFDSVGGVAAWDNTELTAKTGTRIENVKVDGSVVTTGSVVTNINTSVANLGSIIGDAKRSTIVSCISEMTYGTKQTALRAAEQGGIGGLVGVIDGMYQVDELDENGNLISSKIISDGLIKTSQYSGEMNISSAGSTIGGLVGIATYTNISDSSVYKVDNNGAHIDVEIQIKAHTGDTYFGGAVGEVNKKAHVTNCLAEITLTNGGSSSNLYVGGLVGNIADVMIDEGDVKALEDSTAKLTVNAGTASNIYIGGAVAQIEATAVELNSIAVELNMPSQESYSANNIIVGGIVALSGAKGATHTSGIVYPGLTINDSVAIMDCEVTYNNILIAGGIIGQAQGSYVINKSASMGKMFANSTYNGTENIISLTIMGGLVGLAGMQTGGTLENDRVTQTINNSYTALTLSTAGVYKYVKANGDLNVYTNSIVGYTAGEIGATQVVYSSDYTLAFDNNTYKEAEVQPEGTATTDDMYYSPINVTAGVLLNTVNIINNEESNQANQNENTDVPSIKKLFGDGWKLDVGALPMPIKLENKLITLGVFEQKDDQVVINEDSVGKAYYPIPVTAAADFARGNVGEYNYYWLTTGTAIEKIENLKGMLLGNNLAISCDRTMFGTISKHSAISNLAFKFDNVDEGINGIAGINEGTIFMCGVDYDIEYQKGQTSFAGVADENKGNILYSYNTGILRSIVDEDEDSQLEIAGIAINNGEKATIENCYFTGTFEGDNEGSGLVCDNAGYIGDSYSAGQALNLIGTHEDTARYHNVYFDYYANIISTKDYEEFLKPKGIVGKSTREMQAKSINAISHPTYTDIDISSGLFEGWNVYSMHNLGWQEVDGEIHTPMTYNYGYPIHSTKQYTYDNMIKLIEIRAKQTGDGTFNLVASGSEENNVTQSEALIEAKKYQKGKLVYSEYDNGDGEIEYQYYDNCSYLINNIGLLELINVIEDTSNKYFELEVDVTMRKPKDSEGNPIEYYENGNELLSNWRGIGSEEYPFAGTFSTSASQYLTEDITITMKDPDNNSYEVTETLIMMDRTLKDEDLSNDNNKFNLMQANDKSSHKKVTRLNGSALFNCVDEGAVIANITMKDNFVMGATLVNKVMKKDQMAFTNLPTTVYNVSIAGVITGKSGDIAGLINVVEGTTLNIHSVEYQEVVFDMTNANAVAGVVNSNTGTINVKNSFKELLVKTSNGSNYTVTGFINTNGKKDETTEILGSINIIDPMAITIDMNEQEPANVMGFANVAVGNIYSTEITSINIQNVNTGEGANLVAGLARTMESGYVDGFSITFDSADTEGLLAKTFAGAVAEFNGGTLGAIKSEQPSEPEGAAADPDINNGEPEGKGIEINLSPVTASLFGGVVATAGSDENGGNGNLAKVIIKLNSGDVQSVQATEEQPENNAFGLVIGRCYGIDTINYALANEFTFKVLDGINVGGIIGYSKASTYAFAGEAPDKAITVIGNGNVGGFIGQYEGASSLTLKAGSATWALTSTKEYAKVEAYIPEEDTGAAVTYKSFGGLFGYWNSRSTLTCTQVQEDNPEPQIVEIVNTNTVLLDTANQNAVKMKNSIKQESGKWSIYITNIGGIVGLSRAGVVNAINDASIGYAEAVKNNDRGANPIYGSLEGAEKPEVSDVLNDLPQFSYIGGIIGRIEGIPEGSVDDAGNPVNTEFNSCSSTMPVAGMYAVGVLIGGSTGTLYIEIEGGSINSDGLAVGLVDVGGLIGRADTLTIIGTEAARPEPTAATYAATASGVIALVNAGGIVGYAKEMITVDNISCNFAVMANMNAGGAVGYATKGTISNTTIGTEDKNNASIVGTVFDYVHTNSGASKIYYYHPTNIGGFAGYIAGESKFKSVTSYINVTTEEEYQLNNNSEGDEYTLHMIKNYVATLDDIGGKSVPTVNKGDKLIAYLKDYYPSNSADENASGGLTNYDAVDGGIGGFAGRLDNPTFDDFEEGETVVPSVLFGDVYAPYGINVGGIIGYWNNDTNNQAIKLPQLPNESEKAINVAGKIFVGGYIGKSNGLIEHTNEDTTTTEMFSLNSLGFVNVQYIADEFREETDPEVMVGNCVGGVIGYSKGEVSGIKLTGGVTIKIYNSADKNIDSSYVGVIAGRVDHDLTACSVDASWCDAEKRNISMYDDISAYIPNYDGKTDYKAYGAIQSPNVYNYGGLVGLVDVPSGHDTEISGKHYYAFTIDMVQNRDYEEGSAEYNFNADDEVYNVLSTMAHYVNTSDIEVSSSALDSLYDGYYYMDPDDEAFETMTYDHNPTNSLARGWAKEYTMFRMWARVIDQNVSTGDSVQVIYNANYINEVYADNGLDEIVYTVYQPLGQPAMLYCRDGIATQFDYNAEEHAEEKGYIPVTDIVASQDSSHLTISFGTSEVLSRKTITCANGWKTSVPSNVKKLVGLARHVDGAVDQEGELTSDKLEWANGVEGRLITGTDSHNNTVWLTSGYSYINLNDENVISGFSGKYLNEEGSSYFKFDVVFGDGSFNSAASSPIVATGKIRVTKDAEGNGLPSNEIFYEKYTYTLTPTAALDQYLSSSGSIFEVCGIVQDIHFEEDVVNGWDVAYGVGMIGLAIAIAYMTKGILGKASVALLAKGLVFIFGAAGVLLGGSVGGSALLETISAWGQKETVASFLSLEDKSYGALSSIYSKRIEYDADGNIYNQADASITVLTPVELKNETDPKELFKNTALGDNGKYLLRTEDGKCYIDVPLTYVACGSTNLVPNDYAMTLLLDPTKLYEESDLLYKALTKGLGEGNCFAAPKYVKVDNELYVYPENGYLAKELYKNYANDSVSTLLGMYYTEPNVTNIGEYAYIGQRALDVEENADLAPYTITQNSPAGEYVLETYNMFAEHDKEMTFTIGSSPSTLIDIKLVKTADEAEDINSKQQFWTQWEGEGSPIWGKTIETWYDFGITSLSEARSISESTENNLVYRFARKYTYTGTDTKTTWEPIENYEELGYTSVNIEDRYLLSKQEYVYYEGGVQQTRTTDDSVDMPTKFALYSGSRLNSSGFTAEDVGITSYFYLTYQDGGPITHTVTYYLFYPHVWTTTGGDSWVAANDDIEVTVYCDKDGNPLKYNGDEANGGWNKPVGAEASGEEFISWKTQTITLKKNGSNVEYYANYCISPTIGQAGKLDNYYKLDDNDTPDDDDDDKLLYSVTKELYYDDEDADWLGSADYTGDKIWDFKYSAVFTTLLGDKSEAYCYNKYIYTYNDGDVKRTLYTRFCYGNNFFEAEVDTKKKEEDSAKWESIAQILFGAEYKNKDLLLSESVRFTLSGCENVYLEYPGKAVSSGTITCLDPG